MKILKWLNNFFHFNKQERNGVFVLCCIIALLFIARLAIPYFYTNELTIPIVVLNEVVEKDVVDSFPNYQSKQYPAKEQEVEITKNLFVFDPNTISKEEAIALGFKPKTAAILVNFRNKGGKFFKPEDLKKLYGLSEQLFDKLQPYILIPNHYKEFKKDSFVNQYPVKKQFEKPIAKKEPLELNSADSLSIVFLKAIGPSFTKRIIKYRTMLGGFHSVTQLKEVYGITDSVYLNLSQQIHINPKNIEYLPINAIDINTLKKHPYFNYQKAQAVVNYRLQHGKLTEKSFSEIGIFSEEKLKAVLPYLTFD